MQPDPWVYYMKGSILIALSGYKDSKSEAYLKQADEVADEAEKLDKGAGLGIRGQIYISENNPGAALDYYKQWVKEEPDSAPEKNRRMPAPRTL